MVNKGLLILSAIMALVVGGLAYFLFVVHAPQAPTTASPTTPAKRETAHLAIAPLREPADDETDLCGYGRIKKSEADVIHDEAAKQADKALAGLEKRLAASEDPREAALGLYMLGSKDALVKLASGSRDPQVYALAFLSCGYTGGGACELLSAEQWAQVEPDNGVPSLLLANAAAARPGGGDEAARNQAVIRASAAKRFDAYLPDLAGMLQWPGLRNQAPQTGWALADVLMGMQMGLPMIQYTSFLNFCRKPSADDATRASACTSLANVLLQDRTMIGFSTGVRLAEAAGWPPDQVSALRKQRTEYQSALPAARLENEKKARWDCDGLAAFDRWAAEYSSLGDRGVAAKFIEQTKKTNAAHGH